jgi:hypothetical protein
MRRRLSIPLLAFAILLVAAIPQRVLAQGIRIRVVDSASMAGVTGALVALLDPDSVVIVEALTSEDGLRSFVLAAGSYRVRVRRIGYRPYLSEPVTVPHNGELTLAVPAHPILLTSIVISARSPCRSLPKGTSDALAIVWGEITKALQASRLTMGDLEAVGRAWTYRKTVASNGRIEQTDTTVFTIVDRRPFGAVDPADLASTGYVVQEDRFSWSYFGPDDTVLLSPSFAATHCFRLARDRADRNLIGVAFEPVPGRRTADIQGVVWVDQRTSELRRISFRYVNAGPISSFGGGGETVFTRLRSGAWIVSSWSLRAPRIRPSIGRPPRAYGFQEYGGGLLAPDGN